jgi:hypothetical protein
MPAGQPVLAERGRWADPRVAGNTGVTQGMHVRAILFDPCAYLISSADEPMTGDEDINVARRAIEQPQRSTNGHRDDWSAVQIGSRGPEASSCVTSSRYRCGWPAGEDVNDEGPLN